MILSEVEEAQSHLQEFASGTRGLIRLAGLTSIIQTVVPAAIARLRQTLPEVEFDIHEMAPAEVLELLHARQVNIGLIASHSAVRANVSLKEIPIVTDPYVFAVPKGLVLASVADPETELTAEEFKLLNSCIRFNFASQHSKWIDYWYQEMLPRHRLFAQCRSYEVALGMVRAGLGGMPRAGRCGGGNGCSPEGIDLYATGQAGRQTVAIVASQYRAAEPYRSFLTALREAGAEMQMPRICRCRRSLRRAWRGGTGNARGNYLRPKVRVFTRAEGESVTYYVVRRPHGRRKSSPCPSRAVPHSSRIKDAGIQAPEWALHHITILFKVR